MTSGIFNMALIGAIVFFMCFLIYGYLRFKRKSKRARAVGGLFLFAGIAILIIYIGVIVLSFFAPTFIPNLVGENVVEGKVNKNESKGLEGSIFNGQDKRDSTGNPKVDAVLEKGDALLVQNKMQSAIDEYEIGLREEGYENVFKARIEHAKEMKLAYSHYIKGVDLFNNGQYDLAYSTLKLIKPNDLQFYSDAQLKMASIVYLGEMISNDILSKIKGDVTKSP
ncbi:MAG: hypothetical protein RR840_00935 [Clostridium sp.]